MLKIFNPSVLLEMIYSAPGRTKKTNRVISNEMGIDEKYLSRQINPDDNGAKMGIIDFIYYISSTDLKPLDYIESIFDRIAIPMNLKNVLKRQDWLKHIAKVSKEAGEAVSVLSDSLANDGVLDLNEVRKCRKETYEALQVLAALWKDLKKYERNLKAAEE